MEPTTADITQVEKLAYPCDKCSASFSKPQALSMHKVRKHHPTRFAAQRKAIRVARRRGFGRKPVSPSSTREAKHRYYLRHKAKMKRLGLNAHGQPFKGTLETQARRNSSRRIEYVWPLQPEQNNTAATMQPSMNFCPTCGEPLGKWTKQL